jgi:hypothetical protein
MIELIQKKIQRIKKSKKGFMMRFFALFIFILSVFVLTIIMSIAIASYHNNTTMGQYGKYSIVGTVFIVLFLLLFSMFWNSFV